MVSCVCGLSPGLNVHLFIMKFYIFISIQAKDLTFMTLSQQKCRSFCATDIINLINEPNLSHIQIIWGPSLTLLKKAIIWPQNFLHLGMSDD